jgi:Zn-dependent oligopeptidase
VRLTADGQSQSQPITIKLDPRVKITSDVQQIFTLTTQIENAAQNASSAEKEARAAIEKVKSRPQSAGNEALIKKLEQVAPDLTSISSQLVAAVMPIQSSEMPPTAAELQACKKQQAAYAALMVKWSALKRDI